MSNQRTLRNSIVTLILPILLFLAAMTLPHSLYAGGYVCGDADGDGIANVSDAVYLVQWIFAGGPAPDPLEAGDANADAVANITDAIVIVQYIFAAGPEPQCPSDLVLTYKIVDTDQDACFDNQNEITPPSAGQAFYGQDAQISGNQMSYTNNGDSTITDNVTGLMWTKSPDWNGDGDITVDDKMTFDEAMAYPATLNAQHFAGYDDWRLPSMKELYSLMNFNGTDPSGPVGDPLVPYIDTDYFDFGYGDTLGGERLIDAQFWSTNVYQGTVFGNQKATFGLNLADGRIKGYPSGNDGPVLKLNYVYFVRGNTEYGMNNFYDNGDGTITDSATGLMWTQDDFGDGSTTGPRSGMIWEDALALAQQKNSENYLGHNDWRLPNAKEMQSILDYSRSPDSTNSAAIDPIFNATQITNEAGQVDYPWYWTSTTHIKNNGLGDNAAYICFGRALGYMMNTWLDVHGAGCQRSDRKNGDFSGYTYVADGYYFGLAPQGDAVRQYNYVRLVRDAN